MAIVNQTRVTFECDSCSKKASVEIDPDTHARDKKQQIHEFICKLHQRGWESEDRSCGDAINYKLECKDCVKKRMDMLCLSDDIHDKVNGGFYNKNEKQFKIDALEYVGLTNHPKAQKAWDYAWNEGHSAGFHEVLIYLERIAEILKD